VVGMTQLSVGRCESPMLLRCCFCFWHACVDCEAVILWGQTDVRLDRYCLSTQGSLSTRPPVLAMLQNGTQLGLSQGVRGSQA
jgi:hypothetical protein